MASITATPSAPKVGQPVVLTADEFTDGATVTISVVEEGFSSQIVADASGSAATTDVADHATTTITSTNVNPTVNDNCTLGAVTYRFVDALTQANDVKRGADADETMENLKKAINLTGTAGTHYHASTVKHPTVRAGDYDDTTHVLKVHARTGGTGGNALASASTVGVTLSYPGATFNAGTPGSASTGIGEVIWTPTRPGTFHVEATDGTLSAELIVRVWT